MPADARRPDAMNSSGEVCRSLDRDWSGSANVHRSTRFSDDWGSIRAHQRGSRQDVPEAGEASLGHSQRFK